MTGDPSSPVPDDPDVARIEHILGAAAGPPFAAPVAGGRLVVDHALWICACVTSDDAPTWLVHDLPDGGVAWRRLPDDVEPGDVVDARVLTGAHVDPSTFLSWLRGEAADRWHDPFGIVPTIGRVLGSRHHRPAGGASSPPPVT